MPSSSALRVQIESVLAQRVPSALTPVARVQRDLAATGLASLDSLLHGGLPVGAISELVGPPSSGRTSTALAFLAQRTLQGQVCAWVDVQDAFDPASAAANGVALEQVLWVRCGARDAALVIRNAERVSQASAGAVPPARAVSAVQHGCGGMHPRGEARGMDMAVAELMQRRAGHVRDKTIGTPGVVNRPLGHVPRQEQVSSDRAPKRRGPQVSGLGLQTAGLGLQRPGHDETVCPRCAEAAHKPRPAKPFVAAAPIVKNSLRGPSTYAAKQRLPAWTLLDQALRATDLLLQAGGFSTIVLDMGDTPPEQAMRIPLATWFRYRQAADQARTTLLVLAQRACVGSSAEVVVRFDPLQTSAAGGRLMQSAQFHATVTKQRFAPAIDFGTRRKPVASTWSSGMREVV